jgi:hypothetical protein
MPVPIVRPPQPAPPVYGPPNPNDLSWSWLFQHSPIGRGWNSPTLLGTGEPVGNRFERLLNIPMQAMSDLIDLPGALLSGVVPQWRPSPDVMRQAGGDPIDAYRANANVPPMLREFLPFLSEFAGAGIDPGMAHVSALNMESAMTPGARVLAAEQAKQGALHAATAPMVGMQNAMGPGWVTGTPVRAPVRRAMPFVNKVGPNGEPLKVGYVPTSIGQQQLVGHLSETTPGQRSLNHAVVFNTPEEAAADVFARFPQLRGQPVQLSELRIPSREIVQTGDPRYRRALGAWTDRIQNKQQYQADPAAVLRSVFHEAQRMKDDPNMGFVVGMETPAEMRKQHASSEFGPLAESWVQPTRAYNERYMGEPFTLTPEQAEKAMRKATMRFGKPVDNVQLGEAAALQKGYRWDPGTDAIGPRVLSRTQGKGQREGFPTAIVGRKLLDPRDKKSMETVQTLATKSAIEEYAAQHPDKPVPRTLRPTDEQFNQAAASLGYTHIYNERTGRWTPYGLPIPEDSPAAVQTGKQAQPKAATNSAVSELRRLTADQDDWLALRDKAVRVQQDLLARYGTAPSVKELFEGFVHQYAGTRPIDVFQTLDDANNPLPLVDAKGAPADVYTKRFLAQTGMSKKLAPQEVPVSAQVAEAGNTRVLSPAHEAWSELLEEAQDVATALNQDLPTAFKAVAQERAKELGLWKIPVIDETGTPLVNEAGKPVVEFTDWGKSRYEKRLTAAGSAAPEGATGKTQVRPELPDQIGLSEGLEETGKGEFVSAVSRLSADDIKKQLGLVDESGNRTTRILKEHLDKYPGIQDAFRQELGTAREEVKKVQEATNFGALTPDTIPEWFDSSIRALLKSSGRDGDALRLAKEQALLHYESGNFSEMLGVLADQKKKYGDVKSLITKYNEARAAWQSPYSSLIGQGLKADTIDKLVQGVVNHRLVEQLYEGTYKIVIPKTQIAQRLKEGWPVNQKTGEVTFPRLPRPAAKPTSPSPQ